jgi:hypothetical protein
MSKNAKRRPRRRDHAYSRLIGRTFRWVEFAICATAAGHKSPRHTLVKAIGDGQVKQIGRGEYMLMRI